MRLRLTQSVTHFEVFAYEIRAFYTVKSMVRVVGIEPTHHRIRDFESRASTNSATPATKIFDV